MSSIAQILETIVDASAICAWENLEAPLQSQIAQAVALNPQISCVAYPHTQEELAEIIACAHTNRWRVLVCGSGSKLHWGGLADDIQLVISTARLNRLVEHAIGDLTVTAEAGMKLADLQKILGQEEQFLAIDPAYADTATLGGIVATADAGFWRQRYGGIRDMLIGISIVRTDGKVAKAGGRVVKNVAGYDLMKLFTGSYGTLGTIGQVTFRIYPLPPDSRTVVLTGEAEKIAQANATLLTSGLSPTAIELVAPATVAALGIGNGIGLLVRFQSIDVSVEKQAKQLLQVGQVLNVQGTSLSGVDEQHLWQQLREQIDFGSEEPLITCKIGVLPSKATEVLEAFHHLTPFMKTGVIHAGSGLGIMRLSSALPVATLTQIRELCQSQGGFLSILEAPLALKQSIDLWGYEGNAFDLMQKIKRQFDPENLFSPGRFVGGL